MLDLSNDWVPPIFGHLFLATYFWPPIFGHLFLATYFWNDFLESECSPALKIAFFPAAAVLMKFFLPLPVWRKPGAAPGRCVNCAGLQAGVEIAISQTQQESLFAENPSGVWNAVSHVRN